jgi:hypothetical protein
VAARSEAVDAAKRRAIKAGMRVKGFDISVVSGGSNKRFKRSLPKKGIGWQ